MSRYFETYGTPMPAQEMPGAGAALPPMPGKGGMQLPEQTMPGKGGMQLPEQIIPCQGGIFVPIQQYGATFSPPEALAMGTAFPCLVSPYEKGENGCG